MVVPGLTLWGGKTPMPFVKIKDLVWDSDLNPEGLAMKYDTGSEEFGVFVNAAFWWAEERSSTDDTLMIGGPTWRRHASQRSRTSHGWGELLFWGQHEGI